MSQQHPTFIDQFTRRIEIRPDNTALIVVDMQNATGNPNLGLGKLLAERGQTHSSSYRFDRIEQTLVPNIQALASVCREVGAPVIYITYGSELEDYSDMPAHMVGIVKATSNRVGMPEHDIVDALTPEPGELVINKKTMGAFSSTGIDANLRALGIETVLVVGVSTNNCVAMTAMEACDHQYGVVVVSDATGTDSDQMQNATLTMLRRLWGRVISTEEVVAELTAQPEAT
ncbi:MAG: isochorismatase family cysteine hydrolase [Pseudomonadota bacterium]